MRRAPSSPPELPGHTSLGLLGSGGFADVFLYEQKLPRRKVAVKVLLTEELGRDTRTQFVAEANLMAQLSAHPFIVTIFHADVSADGRPYFVMEYCSGPSLSERYKRQPFSVEDALRTGVRLAGAIATAHAAGILHRDIKPANVLTNDYGWPALTDFGISSNLDGELPVHTVTAPEASATGTGQSAVGLSVPWSPPEMFEDDPKPDTRSDVFSLAATVYTLLAGRTPFEIPGRSNGSLDLIGRIERGSITPIDRPDVPRSLTAVLAKGMSTRRDDRYPSALEFARGLQRVELELGYAATNIEVPNLTTVRDATNEVDEADATRARSVRTVEAQAPTVVPAAPAAPLDADRTQARTPQRIAAQPPTPTADAFTSGQVDQSTVVRPPVVDPADIAPQDVTVVRGRRGTQPAAADATAMRASTANRSTTAGDGPAAEADAAPGRRSKLAIAIAAIAVVIVAGVVGVAIAMSGSVPRPGAETTPSGLGEEAVIAATVPAATVDVGVVSPDGASVAFAVAHDDPVEGDRYRWKRADGTGVTEVTDGPTIIVADPGAGAVCIDVQVQRGSKTSEPVRGCSG